MSKDAAAAPLPEETPATQTSQELFNSFLNAPVTKLDADEYTAQDIDGVTESVVGSGNMNFLMMQAGQTNESIQNTNPFAAPFNAMDMDSWAMGAGLGGGKTALSSDTAFDRAPADGGFGFGDAANMPANNSSAQAGSLGASTLAANTASLNPLSDSSVFSSASLTSSSSTPPAPPSNGRDGQSGQNGDSGTIGQDGSSGTDGSNGTNGTDGTPGGGDTYIDNSITIINEDVADIIENIYEDTTTLLETIINNAGDVITNITDNTTTLLETIINNAGDTITNIAGDTTTLLETIINNAGDIINNTTNNLTEIINNFNDGDGIGPVGISLDATIDGTTNLVLDIISGNNILNVLNQTINTAPILTPVTDLVGDLMSSTALDVILNPFQYDNSPNDTDLHIGTQLDLLGIAIPPLSLDIPLDPVEGLLGDIDISLDLTNDLLGGLGIPLGGGSEDTDLALGNGLDGLGLAPVLNGLEVITDPVENLVGDLDIVGNLGLGLLGTDTNNGGADTDIVLPIDLNLVGGGLLGDTINISLDPVEQLLGDIDLDLTVAGNILGNTADPLIDALAGGTGGNGILSTIGDALGSVVSDILPIGGGGDTDLALGTGIDLLDQPLLQDGLGLVLDPVEDLAGDLDLGGSIGLDLLGTANGGPDGADLTLPIDLALIDNPLLNDGIALNLDAVESITGDIDLDLGLAGELLGAQAGGLFDTADGGSGTDNLLADVGDLVSDIAGGLLPFDNDAADPDIALSTGTEIFDSPLLSEGADIVLDPVESIVGDIDLGANIGLDLLGTANDSGPDSDLNIGFADIGLNGYEINLDVVEAITGDIDLGLNLTTDLTNGIGDPNETGAELLGNLLGTLDNVVNTAVDILESAPDTTGTLLGDITGILGNAGLDIPSWTETTLPDPGNLLGGGLPDIGSMLPDPVIPEPIAAVLPAPVAPIVSGLGNLLGGGGNHHHGGLFG